MEIFSKQKGVFLQQRAGKFTGVDCVAGSAKPIEFKFTFRCFTLGVNLEETIVIKTLEKNHYCATIRKAGRTQFAFHLKQESMSLNGERIL